MLDSFSSLRDTLSQHVEMAILLDILLAIAIIGAAWLIRGLIPTLLKSLPGMGRGKKLIQEIEKPLQIFALIIGLYAAAETLSLTGTYRVIINNIIKSLTVLALFWGGDKLARISLRRFQDMIAARLSSTIFNWINKSLTILLSCFGIAAVLEIWGIRIAPLLAGLGIFGIAIAMGAQDLFRNLIAGMIILAEKRFSLGDWIRVEGVVEGVVERMDFRSTLIRRFDDAPVHVPNSALSDSVVTNFSGMTKRRIKWIIGIEYSANIDQLKNIRNNIENWLIAHDSFAKPPDASLFVCIERFGDSSVDLLIYCFTSTTNWGEWLKLREELALQLKRIIAEAGTSFAFPSRTLYMRDADISDNLLAGVGQNNQSD